MHLIGTDDNVQSQGAFCELEQKGEEGNSLQPNQSYPWFSCRRIDTADS
jgi:hypothetical protein